MRRHGRKEVAIRPIRNAAGAFVVVLLGLGMVQPPCAVGDDSKPPDSSSRQSVSPRQLIEQHLAIGKTLLEQGHSLDAQAQFRAILQLDATHSEALRLMTKAQQQLQGQQATDRRHRDQLRRQAQDIAVDVARQKAKRLAQQDAQAREQVSRTRQLQLKWLYNRGTALYRSGDYPGAIEAFQRMALLDPDHPLVRDAQRLITLAEAKQSGHQARQRASLARSGADVPQLERQLAAKRIETETALKYGHLALKDRNFDGAVELAQRALVQDPQNLQAQQLLQQAQLAKMDEEGNRLKRRVEQDERSMINDVLRAQILPQAKPIASASGPLEHPAADSTISSKLRQPISVDFKDVPLADVLEFLGDASSVSIIPSPQLDLKTRRVSLSVKDLPLDMVLKYLAKNQSLAYRVEQDAILLATDEEFSNEPLETRVFFLRKGIGPFALETSAVEPNAKLSMEPMKDLIEHTVPQPTGSKLVMDERTGALVSTNTSENLRLTERLLSQLDVTPLQVLIEARFIELTASDLEQLGVETNLTRNYALTKRQAGVNGRDPSTVLSADSGAKFADLARQDEGGNLTLEGVLTAAQFESVLHALEETRNSKTLSAPRVTALNNQTAQIRVVDEFNYPTRYEVSRIQFDINGDGDFDDAGETEFANVPQDFQKRDIGILLNVTPSVGKDLKTITLVLAPEVSQFSEFRDLGGGVTVPVFTSSQLTTSIVVDDGQTAVLGGLMKDTTVTTESKVPVLGDLPLIGGLFRQKETSNTRKNLLIFITARLLAPRGQTT